MKRELHSTPLFSQINIHLFEIYALMWRGGCIIRSTFLGDIKKAFDINLGLENLLLNPHFKEIVDLPVE